MSIIIYDYICVRVWVSVYFNIKWRYYYINYYISQCHNRQFEFAPIFSL